MAIPLTKCWLCEIINEHIKNVIGIEFNEIPGRCIILITTSSAIAQEEIIELEQDERLPCLVCFEYKTAKS